MAERDHSWRSEARALGNAAVPYARAQRIRRRLFERAGMPLDRRHRHGALMLAFVAGAMLVWFAARLPALPTDTAPRMADTALEPAVVIESSSAAISEPPLRVFPPTPPTPNTTPWTLRGSSCQAMSLAESRPVSIDHSCSVAAPGIDVRPRGNASLLRRDRELALQQGVVQVVVEPHPLERVPLVVTTNAARFQSVDSKFVLDQGSRGGSIVLEHGRVQVEATDGRTFTLQAGDALRWTASVSGWQWTPPTTTRKTRAHRASTSRGDAKPEPAAPPQAKPSLRPPPIHGDVIVREVERLQTRGQIAGAIRRLQIGLDQVMLHERPVLAFELGKLLETAYGRDRACAHWRQFADAYADSRYAELGRREQNRLGCR